jgi:YD repeat-containing protein
MGNGIYSYIFNANTRNGYTVRNGLSPFSISSLYYNPEKNLGGSPGCNCGGEGRGNVPVITRDPINVSTGNSYVEEEDFKSGNWLVLRRFYNSQPGIAGASMGVLWRHSFDRALYFFGSPISTAALLRPDGIEEIFTKANGIWSAEADNPDTLTEVDNSAGVATGYRVFVASLRHTETYNANGQLLTVTDETGQGITLGYGGAPNYLLSSVTGPTGRQLRFTYDASYNLTKVTLPDGSALNYAYDSNGNLTSVTYPDGKVKTYVYNEPSLTGGASFPNALTGIVDESGTRYESTSYIGSGTYVGYASASNHTGNVDATQITYNSNGSATVQYPLGLSATLGIATVQGVNKVASVSTDCGPSCNQPYSARTYDTNGYPVSVTDWNGNVTQTTYDANGLLDKQIDASGTSSQRTTNITWNTTLRVPLTRTVLDANSTTVSSTQWVYNTAGQPLARCAIDPGNSAASGYACSATGTVPTGVRRWTYTYCTAVDGTQCPLVGLLLTATGPRTDVAQTTTYSYYLDSASSGCPTPGGACHQPGDLHTVTDPAGHVTTIASYDADGRVTRETDANGINTDLTYTPRGWLASRTVGGAQTTFGYTPYGAVSSVTDPDGVTTTYGYDAAHRLVKITDAQGNCVQYTLDAAGNKTAEQVFDSSGTVHQSLSRTFNPLGQLTTVVDGLNHTVFNASAAGSYDANGNLVQSSNGLGIQRQSSYDALNRLVQTIDNYNGTN